VAPDVATDKCLKL